MRMPTKYSIALWALLYLVFGYFSLLLDDPAGRASYVWLPAGIAVAALILAERRHWPALAGALFLAQLVLGLLWGDHVATALVLSISGPLSFLLAAWVIRALSPRTQGLGFIGALVAGALAGAALSAALGGGWLMYSKSLPAWPILMVWGAANVAGTLIVTPVLTSWANFRARRSGGPSARDLRVGGLAYAALVVSTFLIFDGRIAQQFSAALSFQLTYLPLVFAVLAALVWGPRGGSIAVFTLALMALYQSAQGDGPFGSSGIPAGDSLLHAQAYLAVAALLVLLANALRGERERRLESVANWHERLELALSASQQLIYQFDVNSGKFEWAGDAALAQDLQVAGLATLEDVVARAHPDDASALRARWAERSGQGSENIDVLSFRLADAQGRWLKILDSGAAARDETEQAIIVAGTWQARDTGSVD
ncbi:MASE1 domain-containing protein [Candidimonas nitroreducens]|uniref:Diguanylate cyclase n=1 Tax=Candidimonas nitroreducens TaxID=683354 RepID=A0A225MDU3_9BURK|nr:MASE1 domain-containing protein [Candidimonas nitroreducens]OWT58230.1 diguanylate cyclase [Candidimonas nitroreducens]